LFVQFFVIWGLDGARLILLNINTIIVKRLFIGVPIKSETVELVVKLWRNEPLFSHSLLNWVKPENWHITLFFLGNQQISDITLLQQIIEESFLSVPSFNAQLYGVGTFLYKHNPKVLWLGLENLQLMLPAHTRMGELLLQNGFTFSNNPLRPHLTVARIKRLENSTSFQSFLSQNREVPFGPVAINHVVLYESVLTSKGPVYNPLFVRNLEARNKEKI
jgi:RNA 2',3'-cyclic 3'-phosphodiesterase